MAVKAMEERPAAQLEVAVPCPKEEGENKETLLAPAAQEMSASERHALMVVSVDLADASSRARARELVEALEAHGARAAKATLLSKRILALAQADSGEVRVAEDLQTLSRILDRAGLHRSPSRKKGLLAGFFKTAEKEVMSLYEAREAINRVIFSLTASARLLRQNDVALDEYEEDILSERKRTSSTLEIADEYASALVVAIGRAKNNGAASETIRFAEQEVLFPLERLRQNLRSLLAVNQQAVLSLSILRETNSMLIQNIQQITVVTRHSLDVASLLRRRVQGRFAEGGDVAGTAALDEFHRSLDELFSVLEKHNSWHEQSAAKTEAALCELRDLSSMVFDTTDPRVPS